MPVDWAGGAPKDDWPKAGFGPAKAAKPPPNPEPVLLCDGALAALAEGVAAVPKEGWPKADFALANAPNPRDGPVGCCEVATGLAAI